MGQFVGCVEGIAEACRALDFPVVSGNVSLYNETKGDDGSSLAILPTPAIGGVGLLEDWEKSATIGFKAAGDVIWLIGADGDFAPELGQSLWAEAVISRKEGRPPRVNLAHEKSMGELIRNLVSRELINAIHDVSDGGILVAIAEMALAGDLGADLHGLDNLTDWSDRRRGVQKLAERLFAENQSLYIVTSPLASDEFQEFIKEHEFPMCHLGQVTVIGDTLSFGDHSDVFEVPLADLRAAHEGFFPKLMGSELTPEF
jgi:phosphoribosylformylglycinamidine synthase